MERPSDLIQSVDRALRLLEVVGAAPRGLSCKAAARRTGLRPATAYHLLRTLGYAGYVTRTAEGDYVIGPAVADRFRDLTQALAGPAPTAAVLRDLAARTGRSVYLARFVDGVVTIVQAVPAPRPPWLEDLVPGFDEAAHATALGKALLSTLPAQRRREYLAGTGLRPFTAATTRDLGALEAELRQTAGPCFAEYGQYRDDVWCLAHLVPGRGPGDLWSAVGVSATEPELPAARPVLAAALAEAAADLAA